MGLLVAFLALIACGVTADSGGNARAATRDHVDRIEINHFVNSAGETVLDQIIFWDFSPGQPHCVVRAWRSLKDAQSQSPYRVHRNLYRACWHDPRDSNAMRVVTASSVVETWTDFDPETTNQEACDRNCRRELTLPRKRGQR